MAVTVTEAGRFRFYSGTLQEIADQMVSDEISGTRIINFTHDGTKYVVLVHK